jgi:hypothetical protein
VHVSLQGVCCTLYFSNNPTENDQVFFGPANEEAMAQDRYEKSPAAETKDEAQPSSGPQHQFVETTGYGLVEGWGLEIH